MRKFWFVILSDGPIIHRKVNSISNSTFGFLYSCRNLLEVDKKVGFPQLLVSYQLINSSDKSKLWRIEVPCECTLFQYFPCNGKKRIFRIILYVQQMHKGSLSLFLCRLILSFLSIKKFFKLSSNFCMFVKLIFLFGFLCNHK